MATNQTGISERVKNVIIRALQLEVSADEIPDDDLLFGEGVGASSIAVLEVVCGLEDEFGFVIDDDDLHIELFDSVSSVVEYVKKRQGTE